MKIFGTVKNSDSKEPIPKAKVILRIGESKLAVVYSDSEGRFEYESAEGFRDENLVCRVEKGGFEPLELTQRIRRSEIAFQIELVPEEEPIELKIRLRDEKKNPLKNVKVSLEFDGKTIGVGVSDKNGILSIKLSPDFEGKRINYKVELKGFEIYQGEVELEKKETSCEVILKSVPKPSPVRGFLRTAGGILAVAGLAFLAHHFWPKPIPAYPVIHYFRVEPLAITGGESAHLSWRVTGARGVRIWPGVGQVETTGSKEVFPEETTRYVLVAENDAGKKEQRVLVSVRASIPKRAEIPGISRFSVTPSRIRKGESATLSWETSGAETVMIRPGIGRVNLSDTRVVTPEETTTFRLVAINEEGKRISEEATVEVIPLSFRVTELGLKADRGIYEGKCPQRVSFGGWITTNGKGTALYRFVRSNETKSDIKNLFFPGPGTKKVRDSWMAKRYGWDLIEVFEPAKIVSKRAYFRIKCVEELERPLNIKLIRFRAYSVKGKLKLTYYLKMEGKVNRPVTMGVFISKAHQGQWIGRWKLSESFMEMLAAGKTISETKIFGVPNWGEGQYRVSIHADVNDQIAETNEGDNRKEAKFNVVN